MKQKGEKILSTKTFLAQKYVGIPHCEYWKHYINSLYSLPKFINNNSLFYFAASKIAESGSSKPELQAKTVKIFDICKVKNLNLEITWISRENNKGADFISKIIDYSDWIVKNPTFKFLTKKWGTMIVDRFASYKNSKRSRFNSKHLCPSTEAENAISQDWLNQANWLVPPIYLLPKCLTHFALRI